MWIEILSSLGILTLVLSLSARRVWIEIGGGDNPGGGDNRHSLRGECGLKSLFPGRIDLYTPVTLCEESVD